MTEWTYVDGELVRSTDSWLRSAGLLYGRGVFTTVRVADDRPLFWEKHWRRLNRDASCAGLDVSGYSAEQLEAIVHEVIGLNEHPGRVRVTLSDKSASSIWQAASMCAGTALSVITGPTRSLARPIGLTFSPHLINSTSPLAGVKSCNYLEHLLALEAARKAGFDEAIRVNQAGHVTSACMANIFWLEGNQLCTPALSTGCLPGTTREFVLENLACSEVEADISRVWSADQIFLSSAGLGVARVDELDGKRLGRSEHPIETLLP